MRDFRTFFGITSLTGFPTLVGIALLAGCVDPKARLSEFEGRIIDAAPIDLIDGSTFDEIPDIGGSWYVAYRPKPTPDNPIHSLWDVNFTRNADGTATVDITSVALTWDSRQKLPKPAKVMNLVIDKAGQFTPHWTDMTLPMGASEVLNVDLVVNMVQAMTIRNADLICGTVIEGGVVSPEASLVGTTLAGQRVAPGTEGNNLPPVLVECPPPGAPDAGVPDAATPDADLPDADLPDANLPDAI